MPVVPTAQNSRQQHGGAGDEGEAALQQPGNGDPSAQKGARDPADAAQPEQHRERRAVGRRGEGREREQRIFFRRVEIRSPCTTRINSASTDRPVKMSVNSVVASQGSAVVRISARLIASEPPWLAMPSTRSVSCRIHSVASA